MKISKICTLTAVVIGVSMAGAPTAQAISVNGAVGKVVKYASKKGSSKMCRQGNIMNGIVSIRSFGGLLCDASASLAGTAIAMCYTPNTEKFRSSGCFKKAKKKLGITDNMSADEINKKAIDAMATDVGKAGSAVARIACTKKESLPGPAAALAKSKCPPA